MASETAARVELLQGTLELIVLRALSTMGPPVIVQVRALDVGAVPAVRRALMDTLRRPDRTLPPPTIRPAEEEMQIVLLPAKVGAGLLGVFGLLALALAGVGIFGVASARPIR